MMLRYAFVLGLFPAGTLLAQPCMTSFTATASPQPVNGTYGCGETVTFCFTVTNWNSTNANWFHGIEANFGPGWDMSTLVPGPPPATCGPSAGTWGWYNNVSGQGPGFFFDLNNDGNPANNYGDFCTGAVNWQFCWTISVLSGPACQDGLSLAVNIDTFSDSQTGSWGSNGCGNDPNPSVFPGPVVIAACTANAGIGAPIDLCTTAPPTVLFNSLAGTPDAGGSWTDPTGAPHSGTLDPSVDAPGAYTYTVTSVAPPCSVQSVVTVSVVQQPDAGIDGAITTCASEPSFPLAGLLGGTPSPGGTWSGPAGASSGTFDPAVDVGGAYTYSFPATAPCAAASATVMVTVNPSPTAGVDGNLTLCSSSPATALFASLGGSPDPGGTWSGPGGTPTSGTYDPATDGPGVYTYTVQGVAPCPNSTATVTVVENTEPDPGLDAATSFCSSDGATPLIGLLGGSPTPGGTWTGPSGNAIGGTLTPATAGSGAYTYTIGATAPCVGGQAVATITIVPAPDAGADGAVAVCDAGAPFSLFDELGGTPDAGGTWANVIGVPSTGTFDPNGDEAGVYTYTVAGIAPCANSTATVTVTVSAQPTAGSDGVAALCESGQALDLFTALGGSPTPGGSWSAPGGGATTALLDPGTAVSGTYTYTVPGTAPCANDVAIVTVTIATEPDPGTDASTTLCQGSAAVDLFTVLGGSPDPGGVWTGPGGTVVPSLFDPATGAPGTYTYTLQATAPCTAQSATVGVTVGTQPDAGSDGAFSLCSSNGAAYAMIDGLGGSPDPGGVWTGPNNQVHGPTFTAGTDAPGTYTYTLSAQAPCSSVSSTLTMSVVQAANAGTDDQVSFCENAAIIDPVSWLSGADAGGTWTDPTGASFTTIDPATATSGDHTYTVIGTAPCPNDQAVISVSVGTLPDAGSDSTLDLCPDAPAQALFTLLGTDAQPGGAWSGPGGVFGGTFQPGVDAPGSYTYTVTGVGGCAGELASASVDVSIRTAPDPTISIATLAGCAPLQVQFDVSSTGTISSAVWEFGDGGAATTTGQVWHVFNSGGSFDVSVLVTDAYGCTGYTDIPDAVLVSTGPDASFSATPARVSVLAPTFNVVHEEENDVLYEWTLDGSVIPGGGSFSWTIAPALVGEYAICLVATDTLGCTNELCSEIVVDDVLTVFVPKAFTPDANGLNEVFLPSVIGVDPTMYDLYVFDRWGNEVFHTQDHQEGWNGAMGNSGEILPQDVYIWRLKARDQFTTERQELFGTITLVK